MYASSNQPKDDHNTRNLPPQTIISLNHYIHMMGAIRNKKQIDALLP